MKKVQIVMLTLAAAMMVSCGNLGVAGTGAGSTTAGSGATTTAQQSGSNSGSSNILGSILSSVVGGTAANVITSVIGAQKITKANMVGTWKYSGPGCAFTSDQLLAKAGGEVAASQVKQKVLPYYQTLGFSSQNTYVTFNQDGTYTASIDGKPLSGKWTLDESTYKVTMSSLLVSINCYAKRNADGIGLLFEASKLLSIMQTMAALSGNTTVEAVGEISKSYDGLRLGFDFTK